MGNLMKAEWYKLKKERSFRFLILLLMAVSVLFPLLEFDNGGPGLPPVDEYYLHNILGAHGNIVKLLPSILAGFFITSEYSRGTMKSIASSGNSRLRIYIAKLMVFSFGAMIISLILPVFMTAVSAIFFGFQDMPEWSFYLQTTGLIMLYGAAFASIMAIFSILFTDSGKTIGFLLMFFIFVDYPLQLLAVKFPFFEPVVSHSIFKLVHNISIVDELATGEIWTLVAVPVISFLAFGAVGSVIFQRKEIK
ncbi:ABC transporter permease [Virgibacillus xinjiangensis]|uniref:ABC transporter permease n=1 Tax=Virgibacillus xinjiangensis TaxID=393090 RepID=A0ABV7CT82_9BACI